MRREGANPQGRATAGSGAGRSRWFYAGPALLYACLIFLLSSISKFPDSVPAFYGMDKLLHFLLYLPFGWLLFRWFAAAESPFLRKHRIWLCVAAGSLYGLSDEWHQSFVPGRDASLWDVLFDGLGVWAAAMTYRPLERRFGPARPKGFSPGEGGHS